MQEIAPGVAALSFTISNVYFIGEPGEKWVIIDTGTPRHAAKVRVAAAIRYGADSKPEAILLTHGHFDHSGSAFDLANIWDIPIFSHALEFPYLDGHSLFPPPDPTVGGAFALMSRFFPPNGQDLRPRLMELPPEGIVPYLPDWKWILTPGHAPGHVVFYRASDRVLLAGDAFTTIDSDSLGDLLAKKQQISRPPTPVTCDWSEAEASVKRLAALWPNVIGCGHGVPMSGDSVADQLNIFADKFPIPEHGRYVPEPARMDETGIISLPPPAPDPLPALALFGITALIALSVIVRLRAAKRLDSS